MISSDITLPIKRGIVSSVVVDILINNLDDTTQKIIKSIDKWWEVTNYTLPQAFNQGD